MIVSSPKANGHGFARQIRVLEMAAFLIPT